MKNYFYSLAFLFLGLSTQLKSQCSFTTNITASGPTLTCGNVTLTAGATGNTWTQRANYSGGGRQYAVAFSIGTKGYLGTGNGSSTYLGDFWEYDPSNNSWTQKANFSGGARYGAVAFSIGTKGYIGTGYNGTYKNDFWEYDPTTNFWTQKANFSGTARYYATGFSLSGKGYIGTGYNGSYLSDFWEYDPTTNFWTQKAAVGGGGRYGGVGLSINNLGYIGTGYTSSSGYTNDFWEYSPSNNSWTQKAAVGTQPFYAAVAFSAGGKGFITTGYETNTSVISDKIYEFDPTNNTWTQKASIGSSNGRYWAAGFAIGGKGYVGTGNYSNLVNSFWEYDAVGTYSWSNGGNTQAITATVSGSYSVLVTNGAGCTATAVQVLSLSPNPTITVTGASLSCAGISNTLVANGASTYTWSSNAGAGNSNSVILTPTTSTTYTLSGSTGSCVVNYPITLNVNPVPSASISVSGPTLGCGTVSLTTSAGGNSWTQRAGLNVGRQYAVGFSIGSKGYLGTGYTGSYFNDFWEYDPSNNSWTQKANFAGGARYYAAGFSIGSKGYIGTGYNNSNLNDFWEYDPSTNNWTQKANFGGIARYGAVGFSIGSKGYIGTGYGSGYRNDFWEYDPTTNTWTQKANFAGTGRYSAFGMAIGTKGYIGAGYSGSFNSDFYEYNPTSNSWTSRASYPGGAGYEISAFTLGSLGYVGTGNISNNYSNFFHAYDPVSNTWQSLTNFGGASRTAAAAFAIGGKGFIGTGYSNSAPYNMNDLWEYTPSNSILWSTGSTVQTLPVSTSGSYSVTVSNQYGCSASAVQVVSLSPNPTINVTTPTLVCAGNTYTLLANGAGTFTWSSNAGGGNTNSVVVNPSVSTVYTVSGTTGTCSVNYPISMNVNPVPVASIAVSGPTLGCGTVTLSTASNGNIWTQKAGLNIGRQGAVSFVIGNKAYLGTGYNGNTSPYFFNDFWEYDPSNNSWTQKANFAGLARYMAVGFSIGSNGYIGTGYDLNYSYKNDFWEYNPTTNTWTQKTNFPGVSRYGAIGMGIGTKGYIGTGYAGTYYNDFYEYDPSNNSWTQKANFTGAARYGASEFTIGSKGYVGTGYGNISPYAYNDLWEYDQSSNSWTQKANFTGLGRYFSSSFSIGSNGYFGTGLDYNNNNLNDFWEYNSSSNTWIQKQNFGGIARNFGTGFAVLGKGYIGTGYSNTSPYYMNDIWQYEPSSTTLWSTGSTLQAIPVSVSGNYSVVVTNQSGCFATSNQSLALSPNPTVTVSGSTLLCSGAGSTLTANGASTYTWSANAGGGNSNTSIINPTVSTIYTVSATTGTCTVNYPVNVLVNPTPNSSISVSGPTLGCGTLSLSTVAGGNNWTQRAGLNVGRQYAVGFSIGSKGYMGTGYNNGYLNDFWEYDPTINAWTQKANLAGGSRQGAVGFSIANKGYVGTGYNGSYLNDLWEYDPTNNTWIQKANFPGIARYLAVGFNIGSKGYLGTGYGSGYRNDFWEYDPSINTWTQKANFGGTARYSAVGLSIGTKGYIGTGYTGNYVTDFWEYDPTSNTWTAKANFAGGPSMDMTGFTIGSLGYVGTGYMNNLGNNSTLFYEYNPTINTWTQRASFTGSARYSSSAFAIGGKGYIGLGYSNNTSPYYMNDIYEYTPNNTILWSNSSTVQAISVSSSGLYSVTVSNQYGCASSSSQSVALSPNPTITVTGANVSCIGQSNTLVASGAGTYTWSANAGGSNSNSVVVTPFSLVIYTVSGTTGTCTVNYPITLNANPVPIASIAVSGPTVSCGTISLSTNAGGDNWTQKAGMNFGRLEAVAFSIGSKGYVGTGSSSSSSYMNDFWEYDPSVNSWTQKANLPGNARYGAVGFNIGTKGYLGTGYSGSYMNDFWEYDPTLNTWTQKANFSGVSRMRSVGMSIGTKGYIGTGYNGSLLTDFWEYDPNTNTWTQKASFGGVGRYMATGFSIGNFGYIGTGYNGSMLTDFWEYNSSSNSWTQKANYGGGARYLATGFATGTKGFIATGIDANSILKNDNWEYDPTSNTWLQRNVFAGVPRYGANSFVIAGKPYLANGYVNSSGVYLNDLWQYDPVNNINWSSGSTSSVLPVSSSGTYSLTITTQLGCSASAAQSVSLSPNPTVSVSGNSGISCANLASTLIASGAGSYTWSANAGSANSNSVVVTPTATTIYTVAASTGSCVVNYPVQVDVNPTPVASIIAIGSATACGSSITLSTNIPTGNTWTQKLGLNTSRYGAVAFSIGSKGYLGTGYSGGYLNDFWEYDPTTNSWTQKANLAGSARQYAVGFSIGSKGYIGTGYNNSYLNDFWEYDPAINTWTQKANFAGTARYLANGFAIGNKGYIGTGYDNAYKNDFWEYDPSNNTWLQKANFSGSARYGVAAFSIGPKGYFCGGYSNTNLNDLWEYNPTTNFWTQRASIGSTGRSGAAAFVLGDRAFVAGGNTSADFWEYNSTINTWTSRTNYNTIYKSYLVGFSINGKGYMGTGTGPSTYYNDIWEYNPPVTYTWSTGSTASSITTSVSGTYSLTVNNIYGCSSTTSQIVSISPAPTISISGPTMVCAGSPLNLSVTGASNFTWSSNAGSATSNTVSLNPTSSATYSVLAASGACTTSASQVVLVNPLPIVTANSSTLNVCAGNSVTLFGGGAATYTWSSSVVNNSAFVPSATSSYTVSGTDYNFCTNTAVVTVTVNSIPVISVNSGTICQGQSFTLSPTGANTYTYSSGSAVVSPLVNNTYTVSGTSAAGCLASAAAISTVNVLSSPTVAVSGGNICSGQSFTLSPSGALTYTFSSGSAIVSPTITTSYAVTGTGTNGCVNAIPAIASITVSSSPTVTAASGSICAGASYTINPSGASSYTYSSGSNIVNPTSTTSYSVFGSNGIGCVNAIPAIVTVTVNSVPLISVNSGTICQGQNFTLNPSGASTYTYSGGSAIVSPILTNTYTVMGTSSAGCISSAAAISTVNVLSSPTVVVSGGSVCLGQSFTLNPSGATNYTYSSGSAVVTPNSNTTYTIVGSNANGCVNAIPAVATIIVNSLPTVSAPSGSICAGSSFTINPSGATNYTYTSGSNVVSPSSTTSYSVYGANAAGCVNTIPAVLTVTVNTIPVISVNSGTICQGKNFTLSPTGANTYTYSSGSAVVSPLVNNTYSVTGTSLAGCVSAAAAVSSVNVLTSPTVAVSGGTICSGRSFTLNPTGAINYTYSSGSAVVSPLSNTNYTVIGASANGCTNFIPAIATVTVFALPNISVPSGSICAGSSYTINPSGASNYTYSSGSNIVTPASTTTYSVFGTSTAGCVNTNPALLTVTVNAIPVISVNSGTICQGQSFTMSPSGANTYTYSSGSSVVSPLVNNTYSVSGTSLAGCISSAIAVSSVTVLSSPTLAVSGGTICSGRSFTLNPTGASNFTVSGGSAIVSPTTTTAYTVVGTGTNGCANFISAVATITVFNLPVITAPSGSICIGNSFTIAPTGASNYTYSSGSNVVSPLTTSTYSVFGTGTAGCVNTNPAIVTVTVNSIPVISVNSGTLCQGQSFVMTPSGANTYTYSSGSATVSPNSNTTYTVSGTSLAGCISTISALANVTVIAAPVLSVSGGSICAGDAFTIVPSGAANYTYSSGSNVVSPASSTSYSVSGSNTLGCVSLSPAVVTVSVNALPVISANSGSICSGNSFTINASGANTYTYSSGTNVVSPSVTSSYSIIGSYSNGCTNNTAVVIQVSVVANPSITLPTTAFICFGDSYTITPSGAITYTYSGGSNVVNPNSTTSYTVNGSSAQGCVGTAVITVSVQPSLTVSISGATATCDGQTVTLTGNGANTYTWSNGSNNNTIAVTPTSTTVYSVTAGSGNCMGSASQTITVNANPTISAITSGSLVCADESVTLTANGASTYSWNNGMSGGSIVVNPTATTTYTVVGYDANGCSNITTVSQAVDACTAIKANGILTDNSAISVYPNPTNGEVNINFLNLPNDASIRVYNYLGQLILNEDAKDLNNVINFKNVANGIYTLRIISNDKVIYNTKLIKQ